MPEHWTTELCDRNHRPIKWMVGILISLVIALIGLSTWSVVQVGNAAANTALSVQAAATAADHAVMAAETRRQEYVELKAWVKEMAIEQKEMSKAVNRLVVIQERQGGIAPAKSGSP